MLKQTIVTLTSDRTGVFPSPDCVSGTLPVTLRDRDISLVQFKTFFVDFFVCLGLRRIVTLAFLRRVQIFLFTYFITDVFQTLPYVAYTSVLL